MPTRRTFRLTTFDDRVKFEASTKYGIQKWLEEIRDKTYLSGNLYCVHIARSGELYYFDDKDYYVIEVIHIEKARIVSL